MIDAPDLRASAAMEAEIENLRSSLAAVDAKCRELRSERDAARRERDEARADLVAHEGMWRLTTKVLPDVAAERDAARREADAMANRFRIAGQEIDRLNAEAEALRWQIEHAGCAASGIGETTYNCRAESLCGLCRLRLDRDTARRERDEERRMKVEQYQRAQDYSREAGALRGVCQLLVEAAFVSETQFVCPNAFEPAVRAARRALSSSRPGAVLAPHANGRCGCDYTDGDKSEACKCCGAKPGVPCPATPETKPATRPDETEEA